MNDLQFQGPEEVNDSIIHSKPLSIPYLDRELIKFLEDNVSNRFPDILKVDRDSLLIHQGKLELIAELKLLLDNQELRLSEG